MRSNNFIEYALVAAMAVAGFTTIIPTFFAGLPAIWAKVSDVLALAGGTTSEARVVASATQGSSNASVLLLLALVAVLFFFWHRHRKIQDQWR